MIYHLLVLLTFLYSPNQDIPMIGYYDGIEVLHPNQRDYLIEEVILPFNEKKNLYLVIQGHSNLISDSILVEQRMVRVRDFIVDNFGDESRIIFQNCLNSKPNYPSTVPLNQQTKPGLYPNSRIEFHFQKVKPAQKHLPCK